MHSYANAPQFFCMKKGPFLSLNADFVMFRMAVV